jgi:NAD(P)-dependent dehydrogenase (short-subunit alcohol dehydrogenase family)
MPKALIFGGYGGIGREVSLKLSQMGYSVNDIGKRQIDLSDSAAGIESMLKEYNPDVVVYAAGVVGSDDEPWEKTFNVNFGSVWKVLRYYQTNNVKTAITLIGSSSYDRASPKYALYAASKAALISIFKSVSILLEESGSHVRLNMVSPGKCNTSMRWRAVGKENPDSLLSPTEVADSVVSLITSNFSGRIVTLEKNA